MEYLIYLRYVDSFNQLDYVEILAQNQRMKQEIDLPDVTLAKAADGILVTHKRTGAHITISMESLQRWLIRQLRGIFS